MILRRMASCAALILATTVCLSAAEPQVTSTPQNASGNLQHILPDNAIVYFHSFPIDSFCQQMRSSVLQKVVAHKEVTEFLDEINGQIEDIITTAAENAEIDPDFFNSFLKAQICGAVYGPGMSHPGPVVVMGLRFENTQNRDQVFTMLKAVAQRMIDGEIPAGIETINDQPVLSLTTPDDNPYTPDVNYFSLIDNLLVFTHSKPMMAQILEKSKKADGTLAQNPLFKRIAKETHETTNSGFLYLNTAGISMFLNVLAPKETVNLLNALGVPSIMAVGYSCTFAGDGMCDTVYLHAPQPKEGRPGVGMPRVGILDMLTMKGMADALPVTVPSDAQFMLSARISPSRLFDRVTKLMNAVEESMGMPLFDGSMKAFAQMQTAFGIEPADMLATLGDKMVLSVHGNGVVLRFDNANPEAFQSLIGKIEKNIKTSFSAAAEQSVIIRYLNKTGLPLPIAPSYAVVGKSSILIATHPQAIKYYLRQATGNPQATLANAADYQRVLTGLKAHAGAGNDMGVLMYLDTRESFLRVYNALLPISNALTALPQIKVDPGLLPPGNELKDAFFGTGVCLRNTEDGITFTAFSPIGLSGGLIYALDSLVVNNPVATGLLAAQLSQWLTKDAPTASGAAVLTAPSVTGTR